tara:strand:+ start:1563 stop:2765 length:1203 start_codon:yes stop_codon:yes gene_type:complete
LRNIQTNSKKNNSLLKSLNSYFHPINDEIFFNKDKWETTQIGRLVDFHTNNHFPVIKNTAIAIFNIDEYYGSENNPSKTFCKIRDSLYKLHSNNLPKIIDLGSIKLESTRKETFKVIEDVCSFLLSNNIIPFVIGGGHDISYAVYKAYVSLQKTITFCSVDKNFDIGLQQDKLASYSFFSKILSHTPSHLFHYVNLGYQTFSNSHMAIEMLNGMNFDIYRLGYLKEKMNEVEPVMRNTDFVSFDLSSIQHSYSAANIYSSPNGFTGEEACKIMRYAGISDKLTAIGIFEYNQSLDNNNQTAQLISQMIWYFLEGYKQRKKELNPNLKNCTKYTVAFEDGKNEIIFFKSNISGRWWMGVPFKIDGKDIEDNYFVACSYQDYELANKGEIPERWIKTYRKFD